MNQGPAKGAKEHEEFNNDKSGDTTPENIAADSGSTQEDKLPQDVVDPSEITAREYFLTMFAEQRAAGNGGGFVVGSPHEYDPEMRARRRARHGWSGK